MRPDMHKMDLKGVETEFRSLEFTGLEDYSEWVAENSDDDKERMTFMRKGSGFCTYSKRFHGAYDPRSIVELVERQGDIKLAKKARKFQEKFECLNPDSPEIDIQASPVGACPIVPAVLAGDPYDMLNLVTRESETGPITIWVHMASICSAKESSMMTRGMAIIAMQKRLAMIRPVRVVAFSSVSCGYMSGTHSIIKVPLSNPLSDAEAGLVFGATAFTRGLLYSTHKIHIPEIPSNLPVDCSYRDASKLRTHILPEAKPEDLVIGCITDEQEAELIQDPAGWCLKKLKEVGVNIGDKEVAV